MSWSHQFILHWHEFLATVERDLRKEAEIRDQLSHVTLNTLVQSQLLQWYNPHHPYGQWLSELQQTHPLQGQAFQTALNQICLPPHLAYTPSPFSVRLLTGLFLMFLAVGQRYRFQTPVDLLKRNGLAWLAIIFVLHQFLWPPYRHHHMDTLIDSLRSQLGQTEQQLHALLAQADKLI